MINGHSDHGDGENMPDNAHDDAGDRLWHDVSGMIVMMPVIGSGMSMSGNDHGDYNGCDTYNDDGNSSLPVRRC